MGEQVEKVFLAGAGEYRRQADENVAVIDPGIEVMTLAGRQQAEVERRRAAAAVASAEEPVLASQRDPRTAFSPSLLSMSNQPDSVYRQ